MEWLVKMADKPNLPQPHVVSATWASISFPPGRRGVMEGQSGPFGGTVVRNRDRDLQLSAGAL